MVKKKKRKTRRHFKFDLERIGRHIGKIVDNSSVKDIQEAVLNIALAYAGYETFNDWRGGLLGPVSLKLAETSGGTPPVAQIAGVAGLSIIGVKGMHEWVSGEIEREVDYYKSLTPEEQRKWVRKKGDYFLSTGLIYKVSPLVGTSNVILKALGLIP